MRLNGLKVIYLVGPDFEDLEFWVPYMRLVEEGAAVTIAGPVANEVYPGKHGMPVKSAVEISKLNGQDFDAIVIPGGWAPDKLRRYEEVKKLVKQMYQSGKVVGLICHAGLVGISAGIVSGHEATGSEGIKDDLINAGATWRNEPAFRSKNIVWGRVVEDIPAFCRELVKAMEEYRQPNLVSSIS